MRLQRTTLVISAALLAASLAGATGDTLSLVAPDRVEEDWQLVIGSPDPLGVGPQITTCMSATGNAADPFVALDMDYREYPVFAPGGLQTQVWSGSKVTSTASQGTELFNTPGEVVTWTQRLSIGAGQVTYDVVNGQSTTWGQFGQGSLLSVNFPSSASDLAGYSPAYTASKSGVSWEKNLVTSLQIVQVRYYKNGLLIATDPTPRSLAP